jgi:hypothetical protein
MMNLNTTADLEIVKGGTNCRMANLAEVLAALYL